MKKGEILEIFVSGVDPNKCTPVCLSVGQKDGVMYLRLGENERGTGKKNYVAWDSLITLLLFVVEHGPKIQFPPDLETRIREFKRVAEELKIKAEIERIQKVEGRKMKNDADNLPEQD